MDREIEKFYRMRGQELVDILFDKGYFRHDLKRKDMRAIEDYISYEFQSQASTAAFCERMTLEIKGGD